MEEDYLEYALEMIKKAEEKGVKLLLPVDHRLLDDFSNDANIKIVQRMKFRKDGKGLDIGPEDSKIIC